MANTATPAPETQPFLDLDERDVVSGEDDGLDLEAYLDLEESPEITRLVEQVRADEPAPPPGASPVPPAETPAAAPADPAAPAPLPLEPPAGPGSSAASPTRPLAGSSLRHPWSGSEEEPPAAPAPGRSGGLRPEAGGRPRRAVPLDVEDVARALGEVQVQGRQLVAACPACGGRPTIVIYAKRFKCFGCEASGDEAALAALLTGWDRARVARWLAAAQGAPEREDGPGRRPWRLSFFAR